MYNGSGPSVSNCFFFVMPSIVQCISPTVDSPQSPLTTWHRVRVAHIDYLTDVFHAISLFHTYLFSWFSVFVCDTASSLLVMANSQRLITSGPSDYAAPSPDPGWCKYSGTNMFVIMISDGCRESHYPHYPIISNDRWLPDTPHPQ